MFRVIYELKKCLGSFIVGINRIVIIMMKISIVFSKTFFQFVVSLIHSLGPLSVPPRPPPMHCDWSSLTAGGMLSVRSVCLVAAVLTALFLSAVMLRAAASVAPALWAVAATCVAKVTKDGRHGGQWNAFPWKPCSRDGGGRPARGVAPGGRTGLRQG